MASKKEKKIMKGKENFLFFWKKDSPFSQFHECSFEFNGQKYSCAEQYMMHKKAECFEDDEIVQKILASTKPPQMKSLGRQVENYDDAVWEQKRFDVVKAGNRLKFSQNEELKAYMFATKGKIIVEASPRDHIWGIGLGADNPLAWDTSTWKGRNLLGYALTEVRDELMQEEGLL